MRVSVDSPARLRAAALLRQLAAGQISYDELEDAMPRSRDPALRAVLWQLMLLLADESPARAREILSTTETHSLIERTTRFLESPLPFEWPSALATSLHRIAKHIPLLRRFAAQRGDESVWPFFRRTDVPS